MTTLSKVRRVAVAVRDETELLRDDLTLLASFVSLIVLGSSFWSPFWPRAARRMLGEMRSAEGRALRAHFEHYEFAEHDRAARAARAADPPPAGDK